MIALFLETIKRDLFTFSNLLQISAAAISLTLSYFISFLMSQSGITRVLQKLKSPRIKLLINRTTLPFCWSLFQWTIVAACREFSLTGTLSTTIAQFVTAWLGIRLLTTFKTFANATKPLSILAYLLTSLNALGLLSQLIAITESFSLNIGGLHISLPSLVKAGCLFFVLIWSTLKASKWVEIKLKKSASVEPILQELFNKLIRISFIAFSVLIALSSAGLDLSAFAVFGGAIGVGIGFGLQKVISNLICGIILLVDRSVKPGDVIALNGGKSYGIVHKLGARCVSVRTRAGKEHLIPNEEFIVHKSENWTFSDSLIRLSIPMQASFDSDPDLVLKLLNESAEGVKRVLLDPPPGARLRGFSDSTMDFELRVWINDPHNGLSKVESDIYINILKKFRQNNIEIPFPTRDLHVTQVTDTVKSGFFQYVTTQNEENESPHRL